MSSTQAAAQAPGLTPRSVLEKAAVQMIDLHLPTTDGRELLLTRYTEPEPELTLLLEHRRAWPETACHRSRRREQSLRINGSRFKKFADEDG